MVSPIYSVTAEFFKALAHPVRIRVLELLRDGELTVSDMLAQVDLGPAGLSQQLAVLRRANLVRTYRKDGAVFYEATDASIFELLEIARTMLTSSLAESRDLLRQLEQLEFREAKQRRKRP